MSVSLLSLQAGNARPEAAGTMAGSVTTEDAQAWRREMERCQMQDWLRHGLVNQARRASGGWTPAALDAASPARQTMSSLSTRLALNMLAASAAPGQAAEAFPVRPVTLPMVNSGDSHGRPGAVMEQRVAAQLRRTVHDAAALVRKGGQGGSGKAMPLPRITLERVGTGMRLWLGVDLRADISSQGLQRLVQVISAVLDDAGVRLDGIILNGRPVALSALTQRDAPVFDFYFDLPREI